MLGLLADQPDAHRCTQGNRHSLMSNKAVGV